MSVRLFMCNPDITTTFAMKGFDVANSASAVEQHGSRNERMNSRRHIETTDYQQVEAYTYARSAVSRAVEADLDGPHKL